MSKSELEESLAEQLNEAGLTEYKRDYRFDAPFSRRHLDFVFPAEMVAIEVQGGTWAGGRHTRGAGYEKDRKKAMDAQLKGYLMLEVTSTMIKDGAALEYINLALQFRRND